jgi:hypothetical protein
MPDIIQTEAFVIVQLMPQFGQYLPVAIEFSQERAKNMIIATARTPEAAKNFKLYRVPISVPNETIAKLANQIGVASGGTVADGYISPQNKLYIGKPNMRE